MTDLGTSSVQSRTITAFFDTRTAAQKASDDLVAAGIPRQHIRITGEGTSGAADASNTRGAKNFWDELKDMFLPDEDRFGYAEGLRRGGYLLAVRSDEATSTEVYDILDRDGAVDMDQREASWRTTGWSGYQPATSASTTSIAGTDKAVGTATTTGLAASTTTGTVTQQRRPAATTTAETLREGAEEVIPVYEETAAVAKRDINHGRIRLRSYVVETPFAEQVNLRSEQVQIERRPVNRTVSATDAVFQDRVIEAEEHVEEAILAKETRVKEEISLRKTVENQAQTVAGTLRHTEVEVEDTRGHAVAAVGGTSALTVDASRIAAHMQVLDADGAQVGTVDHMDGPDRIKLAKSTSPDGQHHFVPLGWVDHVDTHVHLNKTGAQVRAGW